MSFNNYQDESHINKASKASPHAEKIDLGEPEERETPVDVSKPHLPQKTVVKKPVVKPKDPAQELKEKEERYQRELDEGFRKIDAELDHDTDLFDEEGNLIEEDSPNALKESIAELKEKLSELLNGITAKLEYPVNLSKALFLKILTIILIPVNKAFSSINSLLSKVFKYKGADEKNSSDETKSKTEDKEEKPVEAEYIRGTFNDMAGLNILFTDNYENGFYKKKKPGSFDYTKAEESIMFTIALRRVTLISFT